MWTYDPRKTFSLISNTDSKKWFASGLSYALGCSPTSELLISQYSIELAHMISAQIDQILKKAQNNEPLQADALIPLLNLDENSMEAEAVRAAAYKKTKCVSGEQGFIWYAIGLDNAPCPKNCNFCSFAEKWRENCDSWQLEPDQVINLIQEHDRDGISNIVLRTTAVYPLEALLKIGKAVKPLKHAKLTANIGDFSCKDTADLLESGFTTAYHTWRLGEGVDTCIPPQIRLNTISAIQQSDLELAALIEPVGPEHSNAELIERIEAYRKASVVLGGVMARVNIPGTPKASSSQLSPLRLALLTAIVRLALGKETRAICSHPPSLEVAQAGANTVVVESGAIPRDVDVSLRPWRAFSIAEAQALLRNSGYKV